ncbi:MAG: hypothetical protein AAGG56_08225 [Pseudomonadota bacterium]
MSAPRILIMGEGISLARVTRAKWLLDQLPEDSAELVWGVPKRLQALVRDDRTEIHDLHSVSFDAYYDNIVLGRPPYSDADLEGYLAADTALVDEVRPDLIVYDFRPSAPVAAAMAGIPAVNVTNAYWSPYGERILPVPDTRIVRRLGLRVAGVALPFLAPPVMRRVHAPIFAMRRKAGLDDCSGDVFRLWGGGDHVWFPDTDDMAPTKGAPMTHRRVGPSLWTPPGAGFPILPEWFAATRPLAYVSLGSTGDASLLSPIIDGLIEAGADILLVAPEEQVWPEWRRSGRVISTRYVDGDMACARADLVVSNGGHPQLMQAYAAGTPVLGVAANIDQLMAMTHAERTGAARLLHALKTNTQSVAEIASQMLSDPAFKTAARQQSTSIRAIDTQSRVKTALEAALR